MRCEGGNGMQKGKHPLSSNLSMYKRGKNCAIFICPYRETAVATIPAIDFNQRDEETK